MAANVRIKDETGKVLKKAQAASITSLGQAGAYIRGIAQKSIKISPDPSAPGHQPHSRKGKIKKAIVFAVEKAQQDVVVGTNASAVGQIGGTHEHSGEEPPKLGAAGKPKFKLQLGGYGPIRNDDGTLGFAKLLTQSQVDRAKEIAASLPPAVAGAGAAKKRKYPARPFMGPALNISKPRLPAFWANSVKGG